MKIKRFKINENFSDNTWSKDELVDNCNNNAKICILIARYIKSHPEVQHSKLFKNDAIEVTSYNIYEGENWIEIEYQLQTRHNDWTIVIEDDQFEDFLKFMENPELYNSTKKYNL